MSHDRSGQPVVCRDASHAQGLKANRLGLLPERQREQILADCQADIRKHEFHVSVDPVAHSAAPYPQELNPWSSGISEPIHSSTAEKNENQTPVQDERCQFGPSAKNPVIPSEGDSSMNFVADQQRLQISDYHFDKFTMPATLACWEVNFKTEVCTCSQFPTEAMHWIKEVEIVDSVDDFKFSPSTRRISMLNFEVLDARFASALNRIIHHS